MAITTPNMGIRIWDHLSDPYNHDQLADNWSKVDFHDHTPGRGVQIPAEGIDTGAVTRPKLSSGLIQTARVTTGAVGAGAAATVSVVWAQAFSDTNYTLSAVVENTTTGTTFLALRNVIAKTTTGATFNVSNTTAGSLTGTLHVIAVHD